MTEGQTSTPVPVEPETGACAWCGVPAREKLILDQGKTRAANGTMVQKFARWAWCCPTHLRTLQRRNEGE